LSAAEVRPVPPVMPTYNRADLAFERGEGPYLFTADNRRFLDFACGIAVTGLGHANPGLIKALTEQANKLWHTSNLFQIPGQQKLAERLVANTFADTVFFGNSGAEAMECAIKVARKYHAANGQPERFRIITFEGAFWPHSPPAARRNIWKASARWSKASTRSNSATSSSSRRRSGRRPPAS
jgi:acetylornithine/N-succinyldiaminopimelate aminotransferase